VPVLHGSKALPVGTAYWQSPDAQRYFGGEPVIDPLTLQPMSYTTATVPVVDLFTGAPVLDPYGNPVYHQIGDPILHAAGDPVVELRGAVQTYLGGEQVVDEQGNPVYTGSQAFQHDPGQAYISDRN